VVHEGVNMRLTRADQGELAVKGRIELLGCMRSALGQLRLKSNYGSADRSRNSTATCSLRCRHAEAVDAGRVLGA
jgi:hypothetical protein